MTGVEVRDTGDAVRIPVHVQPRAKREGVVGEHGGALKVAVTAPPVGGAANAAVVELLASALGVPRGALEVVSGHASRRKVIEVRGVSAAEVRRKLGL